MHLGSLSNNIFRYSFGWSSNSLKNLCAISPSRLLSLACDALFHMAYHGAFEALSKFWTFGDWDCRWGTRPPVYRSLQIKVRNLLSVFAENKGTKQIIRNLRDYIIVNELNRQEISWQPHRSYITISKKQTLIEEIIKNTTT